MALLVALADLGGVWPTEVGARGHECRRRCGAAKAVTFLFRKAREAGQIASQEALSDPRPVISSSPWASSARSSSIIPATSTSSSSTTPTRAGLEPDVEPSIFFVRLTRELVRLMQEHTADGYVFRTDLRLRPDPGATQIALSTDAGLTYYESFGQNWERAALIKARIAAGDAEAGEEFLRQLAPFIWRKYLDYAAIADIHAMKRRVHAYKGHGAIAVEGHDIKLGRGGIRDIEFFAQTQQLIVGGRHPEFAAAARSRRSSGSPKAAGSAEEAAERPDRGLSLPAPGREPAADGRRPADAYPSRGA